MDNITYNAVDHNQQVESNVPQTEILQTPNVQAQYNTNQVDPLMANQGEITSSSLINNEFTRNKKKYDDPVDNNRLIDLKITIGNYLTSSFKEKIYSFYEADIQHIDYYTIEELEDLLKKFETITDKTIIKGSSKEIFGLLADVYETACVGGGIKCKGVAKELKDKEGIDLLLESILLKRKISMTPETQLILTVAGVTAKLHYENDIKDTINDEKAGIKPKIEKMKEINVSDNIMHRGADL
jgi:hypothetical protein